MKVIKVGLFFFLLHSPSISSLKGNIIPIKCLTYNNSFTFTWILCSWEQNSGPVNSICGTQIILTLSHSYFVTNLARKWVTLLGKSWYHSDFYHKRGKERLKEIESHWRGRNEVGRQANGTLGTMFWILLPHSCLFPWNTPFVSGLLWNIMRKVLGTQCLPTFSGFLECVNAIGLVCQWVL